MRGQPTSIPAAIRAGLLIAAVALLGCAERDDARTDAQPVTARPPAQSAPAAAGSARTTLAPPPVSPSLGDHVADAGGIGRIRLGQTLDEARRAVPVASFERDSDGDGAILVAVTLAGGERMVLYADEESAEQIDWTKRISYVETFDSTFATAEGVHPGSLVSDAEKVYGKVAQIVLSEIESRQYVTLEHQPAGLQFRLDYSGEFDVGQRTTTRYRPGAKIHSIIVAR